MEVTETIERLRKKGYLISSSAFEKIKSAEDPEELVKRALHNVGSGLFIDVDDLQPKAKSKLALDSEKIEIVVHRGTFKPLAREYDAEVDVLQDFNQEASTSSGDFTDFVDYFLDRYDQFFQILKNRGENDLVKIRDLKKREAGVRIIAMITDKRLTKNGNVLLTLEDPNGSVNALIPSSNRYLMRLTNSLVLDEVIAVDGRMSKGLLIVDNLYEPDLPVRDVKTTEEDLAIAMLSDLHIGSKQFMRKNFERLIAWLNGYCDNEKEKELAGKVKYITIAGDIVDGIGIYPGQEKDLEITDVYDQYAMLEQYIEQIPEYIHVILSPGDHDAVKRADPQPKLPRSLVPALYDMDNVTLISSPGLVSLHGLKTLIYHGTSFIDFIATIPGASFENGANIMIEMLKKRHIHPVYGGKPITPEKRDWLVISDVPNIFHTGESHNNSYDVYKGCICVNSGTWQDITEYIVSQGYRATPCILPVLNTRSGSITAIHF